MFTPLRAIHSLLKQTSKFNTVNLHHQNPLHNIFFDQMLVASKLQLSPQIHSLFSTPSTKKIIFDKISYYPMTLSSPPFHLSQNDIEQIQLKYKFLYNHSKFVPLTPFLGYQIINPHHKNWFIWSYTDVKFVDGSNEFMNQLYDLKYPQNSFFNHFILDSLIQYDCKKK